MAIREIIETVTGSNRRLNETGNDRTNPTIDHFAAFERKRKFAAYAQTNLTLRTNKT